MSKIKNEKKMIDYLQDNLFYYESLKTNRLMFLMKWFSKASRAKILAKRNLEASIIRCDTIMAEIRKRKKKDYLDEELLFEIVSKEEALKIYLEYYDGDAAKALAYAKGEVAYMENLNNFAQHLLMKPVLNKLLIPVLLILFTALMGNIIGTVLQEKSFERKKRYEEVMKRLTEGERLAGELYLGLRDTHYWIKRRDASGFLDKTDGRFLRNHQKELDRLQNFTLDNKTNKEIYKAMEDANKEINDYIKYVEKKEPEKITNSGDFDLTKFMFVRRAFSVALIRHMSQEFK